MNISVLRIISTAAVILLHTFSTLYDNKELFDLSEGQIRNCAVIYRMFHWAVPVFFIMTGFLLLDRDKKINYEECIKKYAKKMSIVLLVFGVGYSLIILLSEDKNVTAMTPVKAIYMVITGKSFAHLWYLYALIGIYLVLPIIKLYSENSDKKTKKYILTVLYIYNFMFSVIDFYIDGKIKFTIPIGYILFYILIGEYFRNEYINEKRWQKDLMAVLIQIIFIFVLLCYSSKLYPFANYDSFVIAGLSISIFKLFIDFEIKTQNEKIWKLDRICFCVYLIHPFFIQVLYRILHITPLLFGKWYILSGFCFGIAFTVISFVVAKIMTMISIFKKILL